MKTYKVTISSNGTETWYLDDKEHRDEGPAVTYPSGSKEWRIKGLLHREDGPAIVTDKGEQLYYLKGFRFSEAEHAQRTNPAALCDGQTVEINGVEYTLVAKGS